MDSNVFIFGEVDIALQIATQLGVELYRIVCHPDHIAPYTEGTLYMPRMYMNEFAFHLVHDVASIRNFRIVYV